MYNTKLVSDARIELALLGPKPRVIPFHQSELNNLVPLARIELAHPAYKTGPLPLRIKGLILGSLSWERSKDLCVINTLLYH